MKRILLISALLLAVIFTVSADRRRLLMTRNVASAASGITADLWQTFESTNPDTNSLSGSDNTALGLWTTNGTLMLSTGAEFPVGATVNGGSDSAHTNGFIRSFSSSGQTNIQYDIGSANTKANLSIRFNWKFTGNPGVSHRIFGAAATSGSDYPRLDLHYSSRFFFFSGNANTNGTILTADTWYRFHISYNQNATCYARAYTTNGVLVGSEVTETAPNSPWRYFNLGHYNSETADGATVFYWDDVIIDWTTATYPLGPL